MTPSPSAVVGGIAIDGSSVPETVTPLAVKLTSEWGAKPPAESPMLSPGTTNGEPQPSRTGPRRRWMRNGSRSEVCGSEFSEEPASGWASGSWAACSGSGAACSSSALSCSASATGAGSAVVDGATPGSGDGCAGTRCRAGNLHGGPRGARGGRRRGVPGACRAEESPVGVAAVLSAAARQECENNGNPDRNSNRNLASREEWSRLRHEPPSYTPRCDYLLDSPDAGRVPDSRQ